MLTQYHLKGKGHNGRAVQLEPLDPDDAENCLTMAAKLAGTEATPIEIKKTEWRTGSKLFIKKYTEPTENPLAPDTKWLTPKVGQFDHDMAKYFSAKDCQVLEAIYREYHEVTQAELEAIMGKALPVSEG